MAEIAVNIVIDKLLPLLDQEARLLGGVHTQVEDIKTELLYIQAFLMDADAKGEKADVSQGLKTWIQDLRETAYSIEDVIDEYLLHLGNPSQRHRFIGFLCKVGRLIKKLKRRHEVASKIRDIQKKVVKLKETSSTYGFINDAEIVVVGMGGLGKTTLAKKVYDNKELVGYFDCSAWITVSQSFKMEELLRNMGYLQDKRYVVVFDDVWKLDFWGIIKCKTFQGGCPPDLEKLSLDIVKRCGGLPLAIVAVGGLLNLVQMFFLEKLASRFNLLKVLDLNDSGLDSFPENLGNLLHLRYLSLRNTKVRMLPRSIGKLQNLQTLDLKYSLVEDLPEGIGCLEELQKLSCVEANHGVGVIKELGKLRQLRKLSITKLTRENGKHLFASITNMNRLESLSISSLSEEEILDLQHLPDWISELQNLSIVILYGSNLMNDPVKVLQALPNLQMLQLMRASAVEELCFEATGFQKLKRLVVLYLVGVKRVKIENGALPLLETLLVGPCPQLEELPPGIRHLTRLTTLEFYNLQEELKLSMIPSRGRNYKIVEHIPNVFFYGNGTQSLRELSDYKS
ncbi:unnamed protein product, partial [Vitis vinifera]